MHILFITYHITTTLEYLKQTVIFFGSLTGRQQKRIDKYNDLMDDDKTGVDGRNKEYTTVVDAYYDLATDFYEWGWGSSFHFATRYGTSSEMRCSG